MGGLITRRKALMGGTALGGLMLLDALRPKTARADLSPYIYRPGYYDVVPQAHLDGTVTLKVKVWCMVDDGNTEDPEDEMLIYLHSMFRNHKFGCKNDIQAEARIDQGWLTFNFDNPVAWGDGLRDRYWLIDKRRCGPSTPGLWVCIPQERNPFFRFDNKGKPGIEMVYWLTREITTVPRWEPPDKVGPGCKPNNPNNL